METERTPARALMAMGAKTGQVNQEELAGFADSEPDDGQRQVGERRDRAVELDRRVEDAARQPAHAHGEADRDRGDHRQEEGAEYAVEAPEDVLVQGMLAEAMAFGLHLGPRADRGEQLLDVVLRTGDLVEFRDHHLGRRQEQRSDELELGHEPPAPENQHDGDGADRGAVALAGGPVLVDRPRRALRENPEIHGAALPLLRHR